MKSFALKDLNKVFVVNSEPNEQLNEYRYLRDLTNCVIGLLASILNEIHGVKYSQRYWKILLGPWVTLYVYVLYKRYFVLHTLHEDHGCFRLEGLAPESYQTALDTLEFTGLVKEDVYNLQLYTELAREAGFAIIDPSYEIAVNKKMGNKIRKSHLLWDILFLLLHRRRKILLFSAYFPKRVRVNFILKSLGKIFELPTDIFLIFSDVPLKSAELRLKVFSLWNWSPRNAFERVLGKLIVDDVPLCFLESYQSYRMKASALKRQMGKVSGILSANAWHQNEVFKQFAALAAEEGTKLYGVQHGGNYGVYSILPFLDQELAITDQYYTWGWRFSGQHTQPMPANKLLGISSHRIIEAQQDIIFGLTAVSQFDSSFYYFPPEQFRQYLGDQLAFIGNLPDGVRKHLKIRPHHEDSGWQIKERLIEQFPDLQLEGWNIPFLQRLKTTRLYICDHLSTTHLEALAIGMPTILYWRPEFFLLTEEAMPYYEKLREVGVLFDNPIAAAKAVVEAYSDVSRWWLEPTRQEAVKALVENYARRTSNAESIWFKELKALI